MFFPKTNKDNKTSFIVDKKTKNLLMRIKQNQIAVIRHSDIDEIAAIGLIEKKVRAVINFSTSITGKYPALGLKKLLEAKIPIFDVINGIENFDHLKDNHKVIIDSLENKIQFLTDQQILFSLQVKKWTHTNWEKVFQLSSMNVENELSRFIDNTLEFALREKEFVLKPLNIPPLKTKIKGKHVVVVVRGNNYKEDLQAIRPYIEEYHPVLIGVDGGANVLIECGFKPDIIIGDMDSVSNKALKSGAEIIVHAYSDGKAPGLSRIKKLGIDAKIIPSLGTSEDIAMLLAYEEQSEIIVALGTHSNMVDFLEKGRKGMASTTLVRMKIGTKLVDAKGVSKLYQPRNRFKDLSLIGVAAITPIIAISMINHDMIRLLQIIWLNLKMIFT